MPFEPSQGITFSFAGTPFTAQSIQASKKTPELDVTSLSTPNGSYRSYRLGPVRDGDELSIEFVGLTLPQMTATGQITWTIDGSGSNAAFTAGLPTAALCTSAQISAKVGELISGNATFRLTLN